MIGTWGCELSFKPSDKKAETDHCVLISVCQLKGANVEMFQWMFNLSLPFLLFSDIFVYLKHL